MQENPTSPRAAFWNGLTAPSWASIVLALVVCYGAMTICTWGVDAQVFAQNSELFAVSQEDRALDATVTGLTSFDSVHGAPVLGAAGSFSAEEVATILAASQPFPKVRAVDLSFDGQTLWETAGLVDLVPKIRRGVVVTDLSTERVRVAPSELARLLRRPRIACRSRAFDLEVKDAGLRGPGRTENFFLDHQAYLLYSGPRVARNWLWGPPPSTSERPVQHFAPNAAAIETNLGVLDRMLERLRTKTRLDVVVVWRTPLRSIPSSSSDETVNAVEDRAKTWAESKRIEWVRLDTDADWTKVAIAVRTKLEGALKTVDKGESR